MSMSLNKDMVLMRPFVDRLLASLIDLSLCWACCLYFHSDQLMLRALCALLPLAEAHAHTEHFQKPLQL